MHLPTHMLAGWVAGNALGLRKRERSLAMLAAVLHDLDGAGIFISRDLYWDWHHTLGHNVFFCVGLAAILTLVSRDRLKAFVAYLLIALSHLLLDFLGSGPGWKLALLWPVSDRTIEFEYAWPFFGWQNLGTFAALLVVTAWMTRRLGRTPLEWITPRLDRLLVEGMRRIFGAVPAVSSG